MLSNTLTKQKQVIFMTILEQLKHIDHFSDAEQHIIHYLLNFPEDIINLSIKDLAKVSHTSTSTVTRLVNKLNDNKGFSHFKASFFSEINNLPLSSEFISNISGNDTAFSILNKVAAQQIETIQKTRQAMDHAIISKVFTILNNSPQIEFFGFDDNLHIVKYHLFRLMTLGKQVIIHDSTNAQFYQALITRQNTAAIVVSKTGENRRLLEMVDILKARKAKIIVMTPDKQSSLGKSASEWIQIIDAPNNELVNHMTFDTSLQYILNVIFNLSYSKNHEINKSLLDTYSRIWEKSIY